MSSKKKSANSVTIYDVARLAGVSPASVSRVLNHTRVRPEVKEKVEQAITKLEFKPNLMASALTTKKTKTIGLLIPDVRNPFYAEAVKSIEDVARIRGFSSVICNTDNDNWRQREYLDLLLSKGTDGIIAFTQTNVDSYLTTLAEQGHPIVLMDYSGPSNNVMCQIGVNDFAGGKMAATHLLEQGHRHIGVICEELGTPNNHDRLLGCKAAVQEWNLDLSLTVVHAESTIYSGWEASQKVLQQASNVTGIVCCNDLLAMGAIFGVQNMGLKVPKDISIVGFDGTLFARTFEPSLTTVVQPLEKMCEVAVQMLVDKFESNKIIEKKIVFEPKLFIGNSTGLCTV